MFKTIYEAHFELFMSFLPIITEESFRVGDSQEPPLPSL